MPVIHVELWKGKPPEARNALAEAITAAAVKHREIPPEVVTIIFNEIEKPDWYIAGKPS